MISSLWSVNDQHRPTDGRLYKRWADGAGKVTKVEALRQAQLDLLLGKAKQTGRDVDRGFAISKPEGACGSDQFGMRIPTTGRRLC